MADDELPEPQLPAVEAPEPLASEPQAAETALPHPRPRSVGRAVTVISLRVVRGLVGAAAAILVIGAVGFVPLPTIGIEPLATTVQPEPAELLVGCAGSLLQLGDDAGTDANQLSSVGIPQLTVAAEPGRAAESTLAESDAGTGGTARAPAVLTLPASADARLAAAQAQRATDDDRLRGLAASGCVEPRSSSWLVGGATTVGRTTLLLLANPTAVTAQVTLQLWGEEGPVLAPGLNGIAVPAGTQRVIPLSGFAPDLASPVVHVEARGGLVAASLQTSVTRVLDAGGVDVVGDTAAPSRELVIPGVRIFDQEGVSSSLGIADYADLDAIARIGNPGTEDAEVEVSLTPTLAGGVATSFDLEVHAGTVTDIALSSALELGQGPLPDGSYTVTVRADTPVVAGVRVSTIPLPGVDETGQPVAAAADLAWLAAAPPLTGDALLAVAAAPEPVLVVVNPDNATRTVRLEPVDGGDTITLELPAAGSAGLTLASDTAYRLLGAEGVHAAISFAAPGQVAGYTFRSPRAADTPLVVRP
ncbi:DUF5719 family protein [Protaetiibacter larvae]|uniref:DUF5719 family protein n=1 Tax=Protaetiibacter larvae TaxID=2592654 RepID=UPI00143D45C6|nr:DUF5719 family protein [Protaetiibacter larvae]